MREVEMSPGGYTETPWVDMEEIMRRERSKETVGQPVMQYGTERTKNAGQLFRHKWWALANKTPSNPSFHAIHQGGHGEAALIPGSCNMTDQLPGSISVPLDHVSQPQESLWTLRAGTENLRMGESSTLIPSAGRAAVAIETERKGLEE